MDTEMFAAHVPQTPPSWCKLKSIEHMMRDKDVTCIQMPRLPEPFESKTNLPGSTCHQGLFGRIEVVKFSFDMIKRLNKVNGSVRWGNGKQ